MSVGDQASTHTILFLASNPATEAGLALDIEARAIEHELERAGYRDRFRLATRWAVEPFDLLRGLVKLKPSILHFSGHGRAAVDPGRETGQHRDLRAPAVDGDTDQYTLFFHGPDGQLRPVTAQALTETLGALSRRVTIVVLSACYSDVQAQALLSHVDCVIGMNGAILDKAAHAFAIGFYGGLGNGESVAAAFRQGCAAISLMGLPDSARPRIVSRPDIDTESLVLGTHEEAEEVAPQWVEAQDKGREAKAAEVEAQAIVEEDHEAAAVLDPTKGWLRTAIHTVPALRYVLAIAAIAALSALARSFSGGSIARLALIVLVMLGLGVLVILFAHLAQTKTSEGIKIDMPVRVLIWSTLILTVLSAVLATSSLWFGTPLDWRPERRNESPSTSAGGRATNIVSQPIGVARLEIDDVFAKRVEDDAHSSVKDDDRFGSDIRRDRDLSREHAILDIRVRNSGNISVNLTAATLEVLEKTPFASAYKPSASYQISPGGTAAVSHVIRPDDVDSFTLDVGEIRGFGWKVRVKLTYNGNLTAFSKEVTF